MKCAVVLFISIFLIIGFFVPTSVVVADCINIISVHYNERAPYLQTTPQGVIGLTADLANLVFEKANISFQWKKTPSKRQMLILKRNNECDCLVGWFKNSEREKFAKYTNYIYQDKPQIALTRADNRKIKNGISVDDILSDRALSLLVKDGYSYGGFLDRKIIQHNPDSMKVVFENRKMLELIHENRYDYFFIAPEEADGLIKASGFPKQDFKFVTFPDMPAGEKRYILCSMQIQDSIIEKLNKAILKYVTNR